MLSHELSCAAESFQPPSGKRQRPGSSTARRCRAQGVGQRGVGRRAGVEPEGEALEDGQGGHAVVGLAVAREAAADEAALGDGRDEPAGAAGRLLAGERRAGRVAAAREEAAERRARRPLLAGQVARVPGAAQRRVEGVERRDLQAAGAGALRLGAHQAVAVGRVVGVTGEDRVERVGERPRRARRPTPRRRSGARRGARSAPSWSAPRSS